MRFLIALALLSFALGCQPEDDDVGGGVVAPPVQPTDPDADRTITGPNIATPFVLEVPSYLPAPVDVPTNPLTVEGIELGRRLFYDPLLSRDSTMSCASCHKQELAFTDALDRSVGIRGEAGPRHAMSIVNLAFNPNGFNWDGSSPTLWNQALHPVENFFELDNDWNDVLRRIRRRDDYARRFRAAFGVGRTSEITREHVAKAIAQFERTIVSADSHFDRVVYQNTDFFTEQEQLGADSLFFVEAVPAGVLHPGCGHCHNAPSFGDNQFKNNGLDNVASLEDFTDKGRGIVTENRFDNGKFRTPTLRNIALTAPYMHDGRFQTLDEVLDHYASGGHGVVNEDPNITGFTLTDRQREALLAFLHSLTDSTLLTDERYANPW